MKPRLVRVSDEMLDYFKDRSKTFNTSLTAETRNLAKIMKEMETQLGIDFKKTVVMNGKPVLESKKKIWVLK